jgi:polyphosphate kinase 2 (PPK2 family)
MNDHMLKPGSKLILSEINPNDCGKWEGKKEKAKLRLSELTARLDQLQEILYAEHKHKVLIVVQGMDGGGKDGTIRIRS